MNDVYIEQFIKRPESLSAKIMYIAAIVLSVLCGLAWVFVAMVNYTYMGYMLVPFLLFIGLAVMLSMKRHLEFDYNYTNGFLEIDQITGKSRRKSLIGVDLKEIVVVAPSKTDPVMPWVGKHMKTYDCTSHQDVPYYCMIIRVNEIEEKVLFEPSEELLDEMKRKCPSKIYK